MDLVPLHLSPSKNTSYAQRPRVRTIFAIDLGAVSELVTKLSRDAVIYGNQEKSSQYQTPTSVQFSRVGNAAVVDIAPQSKFGERIVGRRGKSIMLSLLK